MIIKMSKIEIVGPKQRLLTTLDLLRDKGVFHPEADIHSFVSREDEVNIRELLLDEATVGEKLFFVSLHERISTLLACLPDIPSRTSYLHPLPIIDVLNELVKKHLVICKNWQKESQQLQEKVENLSRQLRFWMVLEPLVAEVSDNSQLIFFGITIRNPAEIPALQALLEKHSQGRIRLTTATVDDESTVGLITTDQEMEEPLRKLLASEQVPELSLPEELAELPFREKISALDNLYQQARQRLTTLTAETETFARRWLPIYRQSLDWLDERIALYQSTASAYETRQCFLVHGWMPSEDVAMLQQHLTEHFHGEVVLTVKEMCQEDLDRVPVLLRNPLYFKPFELFARLLPLPRYSSYDPTPFLGLFFPLLFGMILGDIGYGALLALLAGLLIYSCPTHPNVVDGAKILGASAAYTLVFGLLFGELFGDLGERVWHLQPLWLERSQAIVPMIAFSISVGAAHILFGLALGIHYDCKRHLQREALVKSITLLLIILGGIWLLGFQFLDLGKLMVPLLTAILLLLPALIVVGGLLAPLELLKSFGNIVSYVRIMAIGLCSVMLAQIANQLGGMSGNVFAGILVAGVLHFFNLLLGVFAPTVHALRLHYVEFFSKFLDLGGQQFKPLHRKNSGSHK